MSTRIIDIPIPPCGVMEVEFIFETKWEDEGIGYYTFGSHTGNDVDMVEVVDGNITFNEEGLSEDEIAWLNSQDEEFWEDIRMQIEDELGE